MSYEDAPATTMLATNCAVCCRPLLDAVSVEAGIGPECRKKHGFNVSIPEEAREQANKIVHDLAIARNASRPDTAAIVDQIKAVHGLGLVELAKVLADRVATVRVDEYEDGHYEVRSPYSEQATAAFRSVPGRRWDRDAKVNTFPASARPSLWSTLIALYSGKVAVGPDGPFVIQAAA